MKIWSLTMAFLCVMVTSAFADGSARNKPEDRIWDLGIGMHNSGVTNPSVTCKEVEKGSLAGKDCSMIIVNNGELVLITGICDSTGCAKVSMKKME